MRVTLQWAFLAASLLVIAVSTAGAEESDWSGGWSVPVKDSMLNRRSADAGSQPEDTQGRNYDVHEPIYSNDTDINQLIDQILESRREGRNLNDYDQVYADGNIDQALMQGNDMQARNLVRDKLCSLGLMSCEVEGKRPYYSNIYAQGPPPSKYGGGPYGPAKPMPPPGFYNGRPPMGPPPSSINSFGGPPSKIGYESSYRPGYRPSGPATNYNGPYLESPPPSAIGGSGMTTFNKPPPGAIIYGSKPPGPVYTGGNNKIPPYSFENPEKLHAAGSQQTNFYSHQSSAAASQSSSTKVIVGGPLPNSAAANAALQQHVHHHFHHVDGADSAKIPSVPIPVGGGQNINTDFSALAQSSTAFTQNQGSFNAGYNAASQGGLLTQGSNGFKPNGDLYKPAAGLNSYGSGSSLGSSLGSSSQGYGSSGFGQTGSGFGSASASAGPSYHSQNPDYYKKELHNVGGISASASNNFNSLTSGYGNEQNSYNGGYDTSRNQFVDCQCVPFNQCPAADRIGRKEDLILPIDPRNLGKDIEALSDEAAANITINANPEKEEETSGDKKSEEEKKRSKREADKAEDKLSDDAGDLPLDAQGRFFDNPAAAIQAIELVQRKILPTYGVSFGLPYPNHPAGYPPNVLGDHYPAQNPYFGALGPNGLNLGLINVNPLVSVQVQKTDYGEKVVKPLVNLHVTPNANIFEKFFKPKVGAIENTHYHHHEHYGGFEHDPHHHEHHPEIITGPGPIHHYSSPHSIGGRYEVEMFSSKPILEYHSGPQIVPSIVHPIPSPPHHHEHHHSEHYEHHSNHATYASHSSYPSSGVDHSHSSSYPPSALAHTSYGSHLPSYPPSGSASHSASYPPNVHTSFGSQTPSYPASGSASHSASYPPNAHTSFGSQTPSYPASGSSAPYPPNSAGHTSFGSYSSSYPPSGAGPISYGGHSSSYPPTGGQNNYPPIDVGGGYGSSQGYTTGYGSSGAENIYDRSSLVNETLSFPQSQRYRLGKALQYTSTSHHIPTQAPGTAEGSDFITFPKDRKRRSVEEHEDAGEARGSVLAETVKLEQRAYYGNRPAEKTCRVNEVCCRRPLRPAQPPQQLGRCGVRNAAGITGRIKNPVYVDGDSEFGEYPWHVAILKKDPKESIYACGGTLIDAQHVITAAHCIKSQNGFDLRARLGEWDVNHDVEFFPYIERDVVSVQIHPEYYAGTLDNDLAVLKLDSPVDFTKNPHISPACLPDKFSDFTGARCWTTGWGKDAFGEHGKYQNILKEVDVPILSHHQCENQLRQTRLGYSYKLNPGFVCAGGEEGKDACKGDGGGPLVCERQGVWNVVGVVSWGIGCGQVNVPGVYVKVSHYLDWIRQITQYYK